MSPTTTELIDLDLEDFRRLGVRPYECRLAVIRQAAARSAKALAERQLRAPSDQVALQLSRVATSAYRLLDPRQRDDSNQRAYVGRILPSVLDGAAQTDFHDGSQRRILDRDTPFISDRMTDAQLIELLELDSSPVSTGIQWTSSLSDEDLLSTTAFSRRLAKIRNRGRRWWVVALLFSALIASVAVIVRVRQETAAAESQATDPVSVSESTVQVQSDDPTPAATADLDSAKDDLELAAGPSNGVTDESDGVGRASDSTPSATVSSTPDDTAPDLSVVAPVIDPINRAAEPRVEPNPIASLAPANTAEIPTAGRDDAAPALDSADLDVIAMTLPDRELGGEPESEFLPDPFAALSEELPANSETPAAAKMEVPPQKTSLSPTLPVSAAGDEGQVERVSQYDPPSATAVKTARIEITMLIPELADQILATDAEQRMSQLESLSETLAVGSADHWTVHLMIAEAAWLIDSGDRVRDRMRGWITHYRTTLDPPLASSYVRSVEQAATDPTRQHLLDEGLILADELMIHESIQPCDDVVTAAKRLAKTLADEESAELLDQFGEAITQMRRQAESTQRVIARAGGTPAGGLSTVAAVELSGDGGIAGRYYCFMLRRWETGLPWLAHTADLRVANVAAQEVQRGSLASSDELVELAERWLACAERETGRTADSMKLHAIDLFDRAKGSLTGLRKLSLERQVDEVKAQLPAYLLRSTGDAEEDSSTTTAASAEPVEPVELGSDNRSSLIGRMTVAGRDLGVQLDFGLGVAIRTDRLDEVAQQVGESLDLVTVDLSGEIRLQNPTTISILAAENVSGQRIWIGEDLVTPKLDQTASTVALPAGTHPIRWAFTPKEGESAFLRIHDPQGRDVSVIPADFSGSVPIRTVLRVKVR